MKHLYAKSFVVIFIIMLGGLCNAKAQMLVSTAPQNKNFLIEKGTGHVCGSCPGIERRCDSVLASHPGRGMLIAYHFGPDALPQASPLDYDFTTPYGDTIYDPSKLNWPFYLNMMVNRRDRGAPYGSTYIFGDVNQVQIEADSVVAQASPLNLYMSSVFDSASRLLTVHIQAYYTAASSTPVNYLQLALTEDSITATQYDSDYPSNNHFNDAFVFMNVFRANLNGFNGDTVTNTLTGHFVSRIYTYTIPAAYKNVPCDPKHCNLTLYATEQKADSGIQSFTGKVINAIRAKVGDTVNATAVAGITNHPISLFPNPTTGIIYIDNIQPGMYKAEVYDAAGRLIQKLQGNGEQRITLDLRKEAKGIYFIRLNTINESHVYRVISAE